MSHEGKMEANYRKVGQKYQKMGLNMVLEKMGHYVMKWDQSTENEGQFI